MAAESDRQQQWALVVRRSFGISDVVANEDAREALIVCLEDQLQENGWQSAKRGIAEPMVDALLALAASEDLEDSLLPAGLGISDETFTTRDAAYRLIDKGLTVVDPQHLVFGLMSEYHPEVVAVAQQCLDRVGQYVRGQRFGD